MSSERCNICPRMCNAVRDENSGKGFCRQGTLPIVARAALHYWEEPCISGENGSGTVFFAGCNLGCVFCQNSVLTQQSFNGKRCTPTELSNLFFELVEKGAHNINLVTATHFVPAVAEALAIKKLPVPVIYNCGGYESVSTLKMLEGLVDVYLPDLKYSSGEKAKKYSFAEDYPEVAMNAIEEMVSQVGVPQFDDNGMIKKGVIVRQLILPGMTNNSINALRMLRDKFGDSIYVSLMAQYIPCGRVSDTCYPEINRRITRRELNKVAAVMDELGFEGYVQELASADKEYIPPFEEGNLGL